MPFLSHSSATGLFEQETNNQSGKSILFQEAQHVKVTTVKREKLVGILTFENAESIAVNGVPVQIDNINSIKYFPKKGRTLKNIVLGTKIIFT